MDYRAYLSILIANQPTSRLIAGFFHACLLLKLLTLAASIKHKLGGATQGKVKPLAYFFGPDKGKGIIMESILIACLAGIAGKMLVSSLLSGTATPKQKHFDGVYISPSYLSRAGRQCRSEFDANRIMASKR